MTSLQQSYWRNVEEKRANIAREQETQRSNLANESENIRYHNMSMEETHRHNVETEILGTKQYNELVRHNLSTEDEQRRSNLAREDIQRQNLSLGYSQLQYSYDQMHYNYANLAEISAHNRATEQISYNQLSESKRSNIANESIKRQLNAQNYELGRSSQTEIRRSNVATLEETRTHNRAIEANQKYTANLNLLSSLSGLIGRVAGAKISSNRGTKLR